MEFISVGTVLIAVVVIAIMAILASGYVKASFAFFQNLV